MERENLLLEEAGGREVLSLQNWITSYGEAGRGYRGIDEALVRAEGSNI